MEYDLKNIEKKVNHALDIARPYLAEDGGGVEFVCFEPENRVAVINLTGNCHNCPLAIMTIQAGIEKIIKAEVEEVIRVEAIA
jgi:Fe-S cluster biogenesis protein NfuA